VVFAKRVAHLVYQRQRLSGLVVSVVDRQRIEDLAEDARIAGQFDARGWPLKTCISKQGVDMGAQGRLFRAAQVVGLVEGGDIGPVDRKQRRKPVGLVETIEIDQQRIDPVAEAVAYGFHALVHDITGIKTCR
jgi:hypothetical protein